MCLETRGMLSEKRNYFGKRGSSLTLCPLKWVRHALDRVGEVKRFDGRGQVKVKLDYLSKRFVSVVLCDNWTTYLGISTTECKQLIFSWIPYFSKISFRFAWRLKIYQILEVEWIWSPVYWEKMEAINVCLQTPFCITLNLADLGLIQPGDV